MFTCVWVGVIVYLASNRCLPVCVLVQVEQVRLLDRFSNKSASGTLHLTATHLIFVESNADAAQEIWVRRTGIQNTPYLTQSSEFRM